MVASHLSEGGEPLIEVPCLLMRWVSSLWRKHHLIMGEARYLLIWVRHLMMEGAAHPNLSVVFGEGVGN